MLAVAAWMLGCILPERVALSLWAVPALILAWLCGRRRAPLCRTWGLRAAGVIAGLYGVALTAALRSAAPIRSPDSRLRRQDHELPFRSHQVGR